MTQTYDVIVIGLGAMGSSTAYQLAKRGQRVLGIERFTPAHDQGSSHGGSRIIRQAYFEDPAYVPLILRAYELWEQIEQDSHQHLLTITGGLMMGPENGPTVAGSLRSAQEWGLQHEMLTGREIRERFPALQPDDSLVGLYETRAGILGPEACVQACLQLAEAQGATLHFQEQVLSWEADPSAARVSVTTAQGNYEAGRLVITPGAWAPQLLAELKLPFEVQRLVQYWFLPTGDSQNFQIGHLPIYIWEAPDDQQFYGFPAYGEPAEGIKTAVYRVGFICTADTIERAIQPEEVEMMRHYLRGRVPQLDGKLVKAKTCMYTNTPDKHFVIATHPEHPQVALAAGFSGHGFKFMSVVGEIMADLATEGSTRQPIALFDPRRLSMATDQA